MWYILQTHTCMSEMCANTYCAWFGGVHVCTCMCSCPFSSPTGSWWSRTPKCMHLLYPSLTTIPPHTHTHALSLSLSLSHTHTHTNTHRHTHTHTNTHTHSLTHILSQIWLGALSWMPCIFFFPWVPLSSELYSTGFTLLLGFTLFPHWVALSLPLN